MDEETWVGPRMCCAALQQNLFMPVVVVFDLSCCFGLVCSKMFQDVDLVLTSQPAAVCTAVGKPISLAFFIMKIISYQP